MQTEMEAKMKKIEEEHAARLEAARKEAEADAKARLAAAEKEKEVCQKKILQPCSSIEYRYCSGN